MLDRQSHKKLRVFVRTISIALIISFFAYDLSWAGAAEVIKPLFKRPARASFDPFHIDLPHELGLVKESYFSETYPETLIIHIQDAHANAEAQENEARLIQYLKDEYRAGLVCVEGGFGDFDAGFFRAFPQDKRVRQKIAKYFLSKSFISGSDYILLTDDHPPLLFGAEDGALYSGHLESFRENQAISEKINTSLSSLDSLLTDLKNRHYSARLKEFTAHTGAFKKGDLSLENYLIYLSNCVVIHDIEQGKFPNLNGLFSLKGLETKIDFKKAETERQGLIDYLTEAMGRQELEELVKKSLAFKYGRQDPACYYSYLKQASQKTGIDPDKYAELFKYMRYLELSESLDNSRILSELEDLIQALKAKLLVSRQEKEIDRLSEIIGILHGLSQISLSPNDYETFKRTRDEFKAARLAKLFKRYLSSAALENLPDDREIAGLEKFYQLARQRDRAMVENSLNRLAREKGPAIAVLVAGGFHTKGITSILKEKGVSYLVVTPNMKADQEEEALYFSLLKDKKLPLEDILNDPDTLQIINSISDPRARQDLIGYWIARASRYYSAEELQTQLGKLNLPGSDQETAGRALEQITAQARVPQKDHAAQKAGGKRDSFLNVLSSIFGNSLELLRRNLKKIVITLTLTSVLLFPTPSEAGRFFRRRAAVCNQPQVSSVYQRPGLFGRWRIVNRNQCRIICNVDTSREVAAIQARDMVSGQSYMIYRQQYANGSSLYHVRELVKDENTGELKPGRILANGEAKLHEKNIEVRVAYGEPGQPSYDTWTAPYITNREELNIFANHGRVDFSNAIVSLPEPELKVPELKPSDLSPLPRQVTLPSLPGPGNIETPFSLDSRPQIPPVQLPNRPGRLEAIPDLPALTPTIPRAKLVPEISLPVEKIPLEETPVTAATEKQLQEFQRVVSRAAREAKVFFEKIQEQNTGIQQSLRQIRETLSQALQENAAGRARIERLAQEQREAGSRIKALEEKRLIHEEEIGSLKEKLKALEDRMLKLEREAGSFEEHQKSWWQNLDPAWKTGLSILAAIGIGIIVLRLMAYRGWQRLRGLRAEITRAQSEKERLEEELAEAAVALEGLNQQKEQSKACLLTLEEEQKEQEQVLQERQAGISRLEEVEQKIQEGLIRISEAKESALKEIEERSSRAQEQLRIQTASVQEEKAAGLAQQIAQLEQELVNLEEERRKKGAQAEAEIAGLTRQRDELFEEIAKLQSESGSKEAELSLSIRQGEERLSALRANVAQVEKEQADCQQGLQVLRKEVLQLQEELKALAKGKQAAGAELLELTSSAQAQIAQTQQQLSVARESLEGLSSQIAALQTQKESLATEVSGLDQQRAKLEQEISRLNQQSQQLFLEVSALAGQKGTLAKKEAELKAEIEEKSGQMKGFEQRITDLQAQGRQDDSLIAALKTHKESLELELAKLSQYIAGLTTEGVRAEEKLERLKASFESLDSELAQKQKELEKLKVKISELAGQKIRLEQEVPGLEREKQVVQEQLSRLSRVKEDLQEEAQALERQKIKDPSVSLAKPYAVMIFDIDRTITDTVSDITDDMLDELFVFLGQGVHIALVSMQSKEEIERHIIARALVPKYKDKKYLFSHLMIYPAGGAQCFKFDENGNLVNQPVYDVVKDTIFETGQDKVRQEIEAVLKGGVRVSFRKDRYGVISIDKVKDRPQAIAGLTELFVKYGWHLLPRIGGGATIHVLVGGVSKAKAAEHFLKEVEKRTGQEVSPEKVLFAGDSFYAGGLDTDVISALPGSDILSVGSRPKGDELKALQRLGVRFSEDLVGARKWQATLKILQEIRKGKSIRGHGTDGPGQKGVSTTLFTLILAFSIGLFSLFGVPSAISLRSLGAESPNRLSLPVKLTLIDNEKQVVKDLMEKNKRNRAILEIAAFDEISFSLAAKKIADDIRLTEALAEAINQENYDDDASNRLIGSILRVIKHEKINHPLVIQKLYWLVLEAHYINASVGGYNGTLAESAGRLLYVLNGREAIDKLMECMKSDDCREKERDRVARWGIIAIAQEQKDQLNPEVIAALLEIYKFYSGIIAGDIEIAIIKDNARHLLHNWLISLSGGKDILLDSSDRFDPELVALCVKALLTFGGDGPDIIAGIFTAENYRDIPRNLEVTVGILTEEKVQDEKIITTLAPMTLVPSGLGVESKIKDLNRATIRFLVESEEGREALVELLTVENYTEKSDHIALILNAFTERKIRDPRLTQKILSAFEYYSQGGALSYPLIAHLIKASSELEIYESVDYLLTFISKDSPSNPMSEEAFAALIKLNVPLERIEERKEKTAIETKRKTDRGEIIVGSKKAPPAPAAELPWQAFRKKVLYWSSAIAGIGLAVAGLFSYLFIRRVRIIYQRLLDYTGEIGILGRYRLLRTSIALAKNLKLDAGNMHNLLGQDTVEIIALSQNRRLKTISEFLDKLHKAGIASENILKNAIPLISRASRDEAEFGSYLKPLFDLAQELKKQNLILESLFDYSFEHLGSFLTDSSVLEAGCNAARELLKQKQNVQEIFTTAIPEALRTARDANVKVARLNIILAMFLKGIHPTQLLIETLEKATSQSSLTSELSKWSKLLAGFKSGQASFDINNPVHVDLEYTTYRKLAAQLSQANTYKNYQSIIQQFRSSPNSTSALNAQELSEIRLAVYEAYRLLEFIIAVKTRADKLGRPLWIVPNLSYGKFAVSPILDEIAKLNIELHYAKVGSSGAHNHPEYTVRNLFTDEVYARILKERPVIIVVDGTQHTMPRPQEGKSSRYPDAYQGYRNLIVALNEAISQGKAEKFLDGIPTLDKGLLSLLHQNPEYTALLDKLNKLNSGSDQPAPLYRMAFWNPAGRRLVVREKRIEGQKVNLFNPDDLNSPILIFVNSALLDEDTPVEVKQWAGLSQAHIPAYFDDRIQIQQTVFAINARGVYLSHALEFETSRAVKGLKDFYKGKLPQITVQPATPESLKSLYEAMLFDLDGTLTDTLSGIDKSLLNRLLYFLGAGVIIGIATAQSIDEVKKYIIDQVDSDKAPVLENLVVFTARGAQAWGFDQGKNPRLLYDRSQSDLNDAQRLLVRQVITQALGSLSDDTEIRDRQALITIRLNKNKEKRDMVNATLKQLIKNNNLPYWTEYSGSSTIHVVLSGVDKGTARDYFVSRFIPAKLDHPADPAKLLIVGDRFQDSGSDRPMITKGARVVSVGGKDKTTSPEVEYYPIHGWKGTNQLLGQIMDRGRTGTLTVPGIILGFWGLSDYASSLNDPASDAFDALRKVVFIALSIGIVLLAVKPAVKCFLAYRLYRQTAHAFSFLSRQEKFIVFREIYRRVNRRSLSGIDPYQFLVEILPVLSRQISNRRILEMANSVSRLKKAKLNPLHVFKYCLPGIVAKSRDTQSFIQSLSIAERFSLALQDKHYDYHQLLKEIMPQVTTITRNIDEFNEAMLLGIALVKSGRNPSFALTKMLPEVISLTKTISEFRLSIYALQQLCLEGFEPTKFLIAALIQQNTQANIDQTLFNWQETRRKFKTGQIVFDPKNELHVNIEYTTFRELADRTLKQPHKYSFREYQEILNNFKQDRKKAHLSHTEKAEVKFAAYEAFRLRQFVLEVKKRADKLGKKVWIVPNLSYGRFAVSPIAKDLIADGAEIHYARIGSSESHENPAIVRPDLFSPGLYDRIMNEQPIIIVVDGTQHHLPRPRQKKSPRYPDAYQGYRNLIIAVNDVISCGQERAFKHLVKRDGKFIRHIRKKSDYRKLRRRFFRLYKPDTKAKRPLYTVEFWNPGRRQIMLREARKEICAAIPVEADQIYQPALIFVSSVMFDEDIPVFIRNWINREKKVRHKPAYFDDTAHIQNIIFKVDNFGVSLSDEIYTDIRREYKRIIEIYRPRLDLSAGPLDPANLPYKAVISDLDGTLADNLQPIQKLALEKLLYLLSLGVQVAVITGQSHKEMERNFISQVPAKYQGLLANLTVYPATGSQGFGFDQNGNALAVPLYDSAEARLTGQQMQAWRQIVESLLKEFALDQKVKDRKGRIIARPAELVDGGSQIIVRLRERAFLRREIKKRLERAVNVENLPIRFKEIGRTGIRMTIKGIDKSAAVKYHLSRVCKDRFGFEPKPEEVLILGNSFDEGDDDRDMMIRGAKVFSVGAKPLMRHLRAGINFYPVRDRQGGDQLLAELINLFPDKKPASPEAQSPAIRSNSFFPLPLLASGNLFDGLDLLAGFTVCCIAGISAAILIFRHKIFSRRQASRPEGNFDNQGIQSDNGRDLNKIAGQIREQYHGIKVGIIGAAAPTKEYSSNSGVELGRKLSNYLGDNGFVFTGGVSGVGVDVYRGVVDTGKGKNDRFFILLPEEIPPAKEYLDVTSDRQVNTAYFGEDMFERRIGMAKVADVLVVVNGRGGTLHEAISALEENKKVIVLNQGGAGGLLYLAKLENSVLPGLADSGLRKEHLKNIFLADISNIEKTLDLVLGRKPEATALILGDPLEKVLFSASGGNGFVLGQKAISAINSLAGVHKELFLEIDADTLIDASKDHLQLKGLGFKAAVASLLQAQVEKQIPEKLRIRLININPYLNRDQIIEVLGLDDSLLERMVSIPEIPEDYLIKSLEPYLVTNSIRIIFEDNLKFWGGKIDVLVKRGQEGEILSSLGLIIAGLAKEPEFYAILPDDLKVFLAAVKDEKGDIALDDQNKIKRLIFKPIEKTKVDTRYLDRLNKANQELEGMV